MVHCEVVSIHPVILKVHSYCMYKPICSLRSFGVRDSGVGCRDDFGGGILEEQVEASRRFKN